MCLVSADLRSSELHIMSILQETPGDERMHPVCWSEPFDIDEQRRPPMTFTTVCLPIHSE